MTVEEQKQFFIDKLSDLLNKVSEETLVLKNTIGESNKNVDNIGKLISGFIKDFPDFGADAPYCPDCTACGEEGCCSPLMCKTVQCHYGEKYIKDYEFATQFSNKIEELFEGNEEADKIWDEYMRKYIMENKIHTPDNFDLKALYKKMFKMDINKIEFKEFIIWFNNFLIVHKYSLSDKWVIMEYLTKKRKLLIEKQLYK